MSDPRSAKSLDRLTLLGTFVRIAEAGSISGAARDLGLSQPSASRHLSELESRLGAQLIRRTTHSLALTSAGSELLVDARGILDAWETLEEKHTAGVEDAAGRLTVVVPIAFGQMYLMRLAGRFLAENPRVSLDWRLEDHPIRFAELGCDCWIKIGSVPDENLVVKEVGRVERLVVAASEAPFLSGLGVESAGDAPWLVLEPFEARRIPLHNIKDGAAEPRSIQPGIRFSTNNIFALREAVRLGLGVAVLPRWFIDDELKDGRLVDVLPEWRAPSLPLHLCRLPGRYQPRRLSLFFELMRSSIPAIPGVEPPT